ncbi:MULTISPECIES: DUF7504 family protein [Halorussus]|uniref:DUF7504 family protein n=1 Tax=Halorussus TaxID=1070314 RepID=UPI00209D2484|nr:hypothetical protein [Halorussus vallis]USZ74481.1 hypothetical protein NGM07_13625 [Halorussus vallis]
MDRQTDDGGSGARSFGGALDDLDEPRNVLVVGSVPREATAAACRKLFAGGAANRLGVLVSTQDCGGPSWHDRPSDVEVIGYPVRRRGCASDDEEPRPNETRVTDGRLSTLGRAVSGRILEAGGASDDVHATDVRVCVDALSDLLVEHEREPVFRFVNMMTGQLRNAGGIGVFHVPLPRESETVESLAPLFDAVAELRVAAEDYQYRWLSADGPSDWRPL